jgi:hypothetical protein
LQQLQATDNESHTLKSASFIASSTSVRVVLNNHWWISRNSQPQARDWRKHVAHRGNNVAILISSLTALYVCDSLHSTSFLGEMVVGTFPSIPVQTALCISIRRYRIGLLLHLLKRNRIFHESKSSQSVHIMQYCSTGNSIHYRVRLELCLYI